MSPPGTEFISPGPCPLRPARLLLCQGHEAEMMTTGALRLPSPCLLSAISEGPLLPGGQEAGAPGRAEGRGEGAGSTLRP